jgi:hypothetical protein
MLTLMQAAAAFNANTWGTEVTIRNLYGGTYDSETNEVEAEEQQIVVRGIWSEGIDKAVAKSPDGGVTVVRGISRSIQIPLKDVTGAALEFIPKKGDLLTREVGEETEEYIIGEAVRLTHGNGEAFIVLQLEGA